MPHGINVAKHEAKASKHTQESRAQIIKQDAAIVKNISDALVKLSATKARNIVKSPKDIEGLLDHATNHIACFYALHALLFVCAAGKTNPKKILNKMSDTDIDMLRNLIMVAQKRPLPNKKILEEQLNSRLVKKNTQGTEEHIVNNTMITSLRLTLNVADWWEDCITALQTWSDNINNFEREIGPASKSGKMLNIDKDTDGWMSIEELSSILGCKDIKSFYRKKFKIAKQTQEIDSWFETVGNKKMFNPEYLPSLKMLWSAKKRTVKKANTDAKTSTKAKTAKKVASLPVDKELLTMQELAKKLGYKNASVVHTKKHNIIAKHPELAQEIESWFVGSNKKMFDIEHLERFKALCKERHYIRKNNQDKPEHKETVTVEKIADITTPITNLLELKAEQEFINWLKAKCDQAQTDFDSKTTIYQEKLNVVCTTSEPEKREELLRQTTDANNAVLASLETLKHVSADFEKAQKLLDNIKKAKAEFSTLMSAHDYQK